MLTWRVTSVPAAGSSWQQTAPTGGGPPLRRLGAAAGADGRVDHRRVGTEAGLHGVGAALVVPLLADHRADQGDRPHLLRRPLKPGGEADALDGGLDGPGAGGDVGAGVGVERLQLARAALEPEEDDRLRP